MPPPILHTTHQIAQLPVQPMDLQLPRFQPDDLVGLTFLHDAPDGQRVCACIVEKIEDDNNKTHDTLHLCLAIDDDPDAPEELIAYNELCDLLERQHDDEDKHPEKYWSFQRILDHQGPLKHDDPRYKGSTYNVLVKWSDGSETWEPLTTVKQDDPVTCALYAKE